MRGTNTELFITQTFINKTPSQKPRPRPSSAHVLGEKKKSQLGIECFIPTTGAKVEIKKPRPASAHVSGNVSRVDMEPMVYGLADNRRVSGSKSDLASAGQLRLYRLCNDQGKDDVKTKEDLHQNKSSMPQRLQLLQPWLTDVSSHSHGVTPRNCLVFVPSLQANEGTVPVVPPVQLASDQLPYKYKVVTPEPWCPKKYDHPWRQQPVTAWQCNHGNHGSHGNLKSTMPRMPSLMKIYSENGQLLHMRYSGKRTANIVRKEIQELEDLLKGIGSRDGCSVAVQYQGEISHLQTMLNRTKGRVEEIEKRVQEKLQMKEAQLEAESQDSFGLKAFYRRHEEVIAEIIRQRDLCVKELAAIEESLDLDTDRKHFKKRMQMDGESEDKVKEHVDSGSDQSNNTE
ncbi:hypothetical protein LSAT2_007456 [Lamellibrachia satsuma]|nr:hypothetical protein LSAT2_007456 [Lamellibrachia satsuma]